MMLHKNHNLIEKITEIQRSAENEFTDLIDYIWKSTRLIDHEIEAEGGKSIEWLESRSPMFKYLKLHELRKISEYFPQVIAKGNLFSQFSIFESYLRQLVLALEISQTTHGHFAYGAKDLLLKFREFGVNLDQVSNYHQVLAGLKIRNILIHSSGVLNDSKRAKEIVELVRLKTYLAINHRKSVPEGRYVVISKMNEYSKLAITNYYAFILSSYLRDFTIDLCYSLNDSIRNAVKTDSI